MTKPLETIDKAVIGIASALMLLGIVVLGILEVLAGPPYGAAPLTNDAGEVVATPMVDPALRTGLVLLGLVILLGWGVYRMATLDEMEAPSDSTTGVTAD